MLSGHEAIRSWLENLYDQFSVDAAYTSSAVTVIGDWAFDRMTFTMTLTAVGGGDPMSDVGKGLHVYRCQRDGSWKIAQDIWNRDNPPPGTQ